MTATLCAATFSNIYVLWFSVQDYNELFWYNLNLALPFVGGVHFLSYCCCIRCCCLCWQGLWDRPAGRSGQHPSPSLQRWRPPRGGPAAPAHQPISISYVIPPTNQGKPRLSPANRMYPFTLFLKMTATWWPCVICSSTNKHKPLQTVPTNSRKPFWECPSFRISNVKLTL